MHVGERRIERRYAAGDQSMPTVEERVAYLEGQVGEHSHTLVEIRDSIRQLERRFDARFDQLERRFDTRFEERERRSDQFERRIETRFDVGDRRFEGLDDKVVRPFPWLVGLQVSTIVAILGALLARP
jgi:hypothetical protein